LAVCEITENPFTGKKYTELDATILKFDSTEWPDGTPATFTGFALGSRTPLTSRGIIAGKQMNEQSAPVYVIDKTSAGGSSGSPLYLDSGKVIGIMIKNDKAKAFGYAIAASAIVDFLGKHPIATQKNSDQNPATHF
jgi:hypothetical protein